MCFSENRAPAEGFQGRGGSPAEWESRQTKGHDTACLILNSEAKVSHRNSTEVQVAILVLGEWERRRGLGGGAGDEEEQGERERFVAATIRSNILAGSRQRRRPEPQSQQVARRQSVDVPTSSSP